MSLTKPLRIAAHRFLIPLGIDTRKKRRDRVVLETVLFPALLHSQEYHRILFIGCAWYTLHYPRLFASKQFSTLEIDGQAAPYGASIHHVDSCEHLDRYYTAGELDCIVFNGVFGFGLDDRASVERTLDAMHRCLRPDGLLIFGWNDLPRHRPFPPFELAAWDQFSKSVFPPLNTDVFLSDPVNRHQFHFFRNRSRDGAYDERVPT
jgi:SAM-dependent methyltransferase